MSISTTAVHREAGEREGGLGALCARCLRVFLDHLPPRGLPQRRLPTPIAAGVFAVAIAIASGPVLAQPEEAEAEAAAAEDGEALELRQVVVTGSRLNRPPSELSGNLIVLDRDAIRASGELTLARVLRQLPQNINATNETYGSNLNNVTNISAASTVNLRGLGSESTLILVDGRRVGYSGILGGVTDISTIPLSLVERIEILLDGASAIYGSDAVGGVVNIITRKDYAGLELDLNYGRPHESGYNETRLSASLGRPWDGGRATFGYEFFRDSGLDASSRDTIQLANRNDRNNQKTGLAGPQMRAYSYFFDGSCDEDKAVVYVLDGRVITRSEYAGLDAASQAMAVCHADVTLPSGFMAGDDLNGIEIFGPPDWGEDAELGTSLRPEQQHHAFNVGVDQSITKTTTLHATMRYAEKRADSERGLSAVSGTLAAGNPYNPFGRDVSIRGQVLNAPPTVFESKNKNFFVGLGADGTLGERWQWEAEFTRGEDKLEAQRFNVFDSATVNLGLGSDGVSESVIARISGISMEECEQERVQQGGTRISYSSFFGGNCTVWGAPPEPIDPFGDLSPYVLPGLTTATTNRTTGFEALARGVLFDLPGGPMTLVVGYDYRQDLLDTMSEFHNVSGSCSPVSCPNRSPVGATAFDTRVSRDNHAAFFETLVPLFGGDNAQPGIQRLNLTFSGRYDSYSNVDVEYRESASGDAGTLDANDPGSDFTWNVGLIYRPNDNMQFKVNRLTAFVAPQLNQLVTRVMERVPAALFRGLFLIQPDGSLEQTHDNVFNNTGGNDMLLPETADTLSVSAELTPEFLPGLSLKATWSDSEYKDRIAYFSAFIVDPLNLPSNVIYIQEEDIYIRDNRWINVAVLERSGFDFELRQDWTFGRNDFSVLIRRSYTDDFDVQPDAANEEVQSLVTTKDLINYDLDPILSPVPKHQTSAQLVWERGGFFASLDIQGAATTRTLRTGGTDGFEYITDPATIADLVVAYDFGQDTIFDAPAWMEGLRATFTVNNLTNKFARNSFVDIGSGVVEEYSINPVYEWTQGRSYRLTLQKSLQF